MRVVIFNYTTTVRVGGIEVFCWGLARGLRRAGVDVIVVGGKGTLDDPQFDGPVHRIAALPRRLVPWIRGTSRLGDYRKLVERVTHGIAAWRTLVALRPDVLQIIKAFDFPLAAALRRRTGCRVAMNWEGDEDFLGATRFAHTIDASTACSEFVAEAIARRYPRPEVVYNGVDVEVFHPDGDRAPLPAAAGPGGIVAMICGRLAPIKGVDLAIRALAACKNGSHRLVIVGDGEHLPALRAIAQSAGVADRTTFAGEVPNARLPAYYRGADVVLSTSRVAETFSNSAAEALACARPVIAWRQGGLMEVVADEGGVLVTPEDTQACAAAIDALGGDAGRRRALGAAGRKRVERLFAWPVVCARMLDLYRRVLAAGPAGH
jgi:D-inositol-3-phosphate glycosyltransferase